MSLEQLRTDMKENATALATMVDESNAARTTQDILAFLRHTLWPTMEAIVDEMAEIDGCVEDLLHAQEDILQPETAELFAALVVAGRGIAQEFAKRLKPEETELRKALAAFEDLSKSAEEAIEQITIPDAEDEEDDEEEGAKS